jgi:hypothetical protein
MGYGWNDTDDSAGVGEQAHYFARVLPADGTLLE